MKTKDCKKEKDRINKQEIERSEKEYNGFVSAFKEGNCFYCGKKLNYFNKEKPCFHWFCKDFLSVVVLS